MKKLFMFLMLCSLCSCGYSSLDNELIGQVKLVKNYTPLVCNNWNMTDISLGVMRNGVGSMSHEDVSLTVTDDKVLQKLKEANASGKLVKVMYDVKRWTWCVDNYIVKSVEIVQ